MNALDTLLRGCVDIISKKELEEKLSSGRELVVKLGCDPTSADLHLGHSVVLSKMRAFQDLGHKGILVIGDFTGSVGDPSGRDSTRPVLSPDAIKKNAETYQKQALKILDPAKTEIRFNSEWLTPFCAPSDAGALGRASALLSALSRITVGQLLEREDFKTRMSKNEPITVLETLYPIFQGYDSVAIKADVELGGSDQLFNLIMGRTMQKFFGQAPQVVMTTPLLVGTDGVKKMSKSYGNYIGLTDTPGDIFGKTMSVSDELMLTYYEFFTARDLAEIKSMHPMTAKKELAQILVERFHDKRLAAEARENFEKVFSQKQNPDDMKVVSFKDGETLSAVLVKAGFAPSKNEARRLIQQGAVKFEGEKRLADDLSDIKNKTAVQCGKRNFCFIERENEK